MLDARGRLLHEFRFAGRSGRHVKWFSSTVKWSGNLNETILAAQTMGPLGALMNLPATVRMATGFTRTGGPLARDLQGFLAPGKMPNRELQRRRPPPGQGDFRRVGPSLRGETMPALRYAYFPGCVAKGSAREVEDAMRAVVKALGIELVEMPEPPAAALAS